MNPNDDLLYWLRQSFADLYASPILIPYGFGTSETDSWSARDFLQLNCHALLEGRTNFGIILGPLLSKSFATISTVSLPHSESVQQREACHPLHLNAKLSKQEPDAELIIWPVQI